jgi:hypothetical protein
MGEFTVPSDSPKPVILPKNITNELLFAARNADKVSQIIGYSGDPVFEKAAAALKIPVEQIRHLLAVFVNLQQLQNRFDWRTDDLLNAIPENFERNFQGTEKTEAIQQWTAARQAIAQALQRLSANHPLSLMTRAEQLAYMQEKLFAQVRIITQIRPVFNVAGDEILRAIISHELIIDYYEGQDPRRIQIAADASDIAQLKRACERAERKAAATKAALRDKPWGTSVLAEADDPAPS